MTHEEIEDVIRQRFGALVEDAVPIPTQYDNQGEFDPPDGSPYARLSIQFSTSSQIERGKSKLFRIPGLVTASLFGLPDVGTESILQTAEVVVNAFRGQTLNGVVFRSPSLNKIARRSLEDRYRVDVDIPFHADATVTS